MRVCCMWQSYNKIYNFTYFEMTKCSESIKIMAKSYCVAMVVKIIVSVPESSGVAA